MSNTVFKLQMPFPAPGTVARPNVQTIEPQIQSATAPVVLFGVPVKMVAGRATAIAPADTATVVYGFSVRTWPGQDFTFAPAFGNAVPPGANFPIDILRRGYIMVQVNAGTPAAQGPVYMRIATPSGAKVIGGIEAVADGANTVVIVGATFQGLVDENSVAEVAFNI